MGLEDPTQALAKHIWRESAERGRRFSTAVTVEGVAAAG